MTTDRSVLQSCTGYPKCDGCINKTHCTYRASLENHSPEKRCSCTPFVSKFSGSRVDPACPKCGQPEGKITHIRSYDDFPGEFTQLERQHGILQDKYSALSAVAELMAQELENRCGKGTRGWDLVEQYHQLVKS